MADVSAREETRAGWRATLSTCAEPANLRRTLGIACIVGCVLTLVNQADVLVRGEATAFTAVKVVLNFVVPFVVSNLGVLAGTKSARS